MVPCQLLPRAAAFFSLPLQGIVQALGMVDMIRHPPAPFADNAPGNRVVRIARHFDDFAVFNMQQSATSRMAKDAIVFLISTVYPPYPA